MKQVLLLLSGFILFQISTPDAYAMDWRSFKVHVGDNPEFAAPDFNDEDWPTYVQWRRTEEGNRYKGNVWMRGTLTFDEHQRGVNYALAVMVLASCDLYLDGRLVASNGLVGRNAESEEAGRSLFIAAIPPDLHTPGSHQIALRFSNYQGKYHFGVISMGYGPLNLIIHTVRRIMYPIAFVSAYFIVAIAFLLLYLFSFRNPAFALFSGLTALVGVLFLVEKWALIGYPYYYHHTRLVTVTCLSGAVNLLLPLFFIQTHKLSSKYVYGLLLLMAGLGYGFGNNPDGVSFGVFHAGLIMAQGLSGRALWLRKPYALWGCLGCAICLITLLVSGRNFMEGPFFYCFFLMILLIMISLSLQIREARRRLQEAQLTAARLETELLKKHIQPHFMLNTLTAAMEWVERDPPSAVRFIAALAREMRVLFDSSGRSLIPLDQELDMCRAHLENHAFRTGYQHQLEVDGDVDGVEIPPAVILTLLENGLTHGQEEAAYLFRLKVGLGGSMVFEVDHQESDGPVREGAGTRYVKARLEESYPGRWQFAMEHQGSIWRSTIAVDQE